MKITSSTASKQKQNERKEEASPSIKKISIKTKETPKDVKDLKELHEPIKDSNSPNKELTVGLRDSLGSPNSIKETNTRDSYLSPSVKDTVHKDTSKEVNISSATTSPPIVPIPASSPTFTSKFFDIKKRNSVEVPLSPLMAPLLASIASPPSVQHEKQKNLFLDLFHLRRDHLLLKKYRNKLKVHWKRSLLHNLRIKRMINLKNKIKMIKLQINLIKRIPQLVILVIPVIPVNQKK